MRFQPNDRPVSGHIHVVHRKRGPVVYVKSRLPDGSQRNLKLGDLWTRGGRPPAGFITRKMADHVLQEILEAMRDAGSISPERRAGFRSETWPRTGSRTSSTTGSADAERCAATGACWIAICFRCSPTVRSQPFRPRIDHYRRQLVTEGCLSPRSVNKLLTQLHAIFKRAERVHGLASNPVAGVERQPTRRSGEIAVLSVPEVEALARAAISRQDAALYRVAAYTGLRQGELRALRWCDVDFAGSFLHVRRATPVKSWVCRSPGKCGASR